MLKNIVMLKDTAAQMQSIVKITGSVLFLRVRQICEPEPCPLGCSVGEESIWWRAQPVLVC